MRRKEAVGQQMGGDEKKAFSFRLHKFKLIVKRPAHEPLLAASGAFIIRKFAPRRRLLSVKAHCQARERERGPYSASRSLSVNLTISARFSHTTNISCSVHPLLASQSSMSKCQSIRARMLRISAYARLKDKDVLARLNGGEVYDWETSAHVCPTQFRGPRENGWSADLWSSA